MVVRVDQQASFDHEWLHRSVLVSLFG